LNIQISQISKDSVQIFNIQNWCTDGYSLNCTCKNQQIAELRETDKTKLADYWKHIEHTHYQLSQKINSISIQIISNQMNAIAVYPMYGSYGPCNSIIDINQALQNKFLWSIVSQIVNNTYNIIISDCHDYVWSIIMTTSGDILFVYLNRNDANLYN
jgi:hypothetical protein